MPIPICPKHNLRMTPVKPYNGYLEDAMSLKCADGDNHQIPRTISKEKQYVIDKIDARIFKNMKLLNLDDEAIPIAEDKTEIKSGKYFVKTRLINSKRGKQLVIYAGEKGKQEKSQIFVEPEAKRLDFDRNDIHPDEVFVEVTAKFRDGSTHSIKKNEN